MNVFPKITILRAQAGEGNYHAYRLLKSGHRFFLFVKYLKTTINYGAGVGKLASISTITFVKGANQIRHHRYTETMRQQRIGQTELFTDKSDENEPISLLPRFSLRGMVRQIAYLSMLLISGRQRYLNLYYLEFYKSIREVVKIGLSSVTTFVCYNDQPYDIASLITALHERGGCRTIVIQHGLILSPEFYFPSIAKEFWAWGALSRFHYRSRDPRAQLVITGRYVEDAVTKSHDFSELKLSNQVKVLLATSYIHDEFKSVVKKVTLLLNQVPKYDVKVGFKLHPATKFKINLKCWLKRYASSLEEEVDAIEYLAEKYDVLVTRNSTSAIDFLLRGKFVLFVNLRDDGEFPSSGYGLAVESLNNLLNGDGLHFKSLNEERLLFLNSALGV